MSELLWDSKEWRQLRNEKFFKWFRGNQNAVHCFIDLSAVSETWDDLIDRDKEIDNEDIHRAFLNLLIGLPLNPFYQQYRYYLEPMIIMSVNAWLDSLSLAESPEKKWNMLAFYMRNLGAELAPMIAFCVGGFDHMRNVSGEIRKFLNHESYAEWEHRHA
jgi:hypothetical protein